MLFVNVQNPDSLFRKVGECVGDISYVDGNGARRDLKPIAAQMLSFETPFRPSALAHLEVLADHADDRARLMRFMMDQHYCT